MKLRPPGLRVTAGVSADDRRFLAAGRQVEQHSAGLQKELRLADLVSIQILNVIAFTWIGTAAQVGPSHLVFWLLGVTLFYIPSGIVVAHLAREMPLEGGLYQWAKLRFGPLAGFLVAMNVWLNNVFLFPTLSLAILQMAGYALGPGAGAFAANKLVILAMSLASTGALMVVAWRGLAIGKWVNNVGGAGFVLLFVLVILAAVPRWQAGSSATAPASLALPALSLLNLNLLAKMGFGALCGVDAVAIFAGEYRSPDGARLIRRSIWVSAPLIALLMILGTASVLSFTRPDAIDLIAPGIQVLNAGYPRLVAIAVALLILATLAQKSFYFSVMVRLPMVAGWDHLLPDWFCRLDARYRTPLGSVLFAGAVIMLLTLLAIAGAGNQEAYQLLLNASLLCFAGAYLVMFAIPLLARGERPRWEVRLAALAGLLMTLLFIVLSVFPVVRVEHAGQFAAKLITLIGGLQCAGVLYFWRARRALAARQSARLAG
ncbi:MAG: APC family permease [Gammaproteobacteria bacterium]|nr:APC family permease [Gammaproteobacteria bacterium]MDE2251431.1 APC family permease [Gammaproteobacteria bacterium]